MTIIVYLLTHPDEADKWRALFNKLFRKISSKREKNFVASDIQYRIYSSVKEMNDETTTGDSEEDILPYRMRIVWTKETTKEAFMRNDEMVVRMDYHTNQDRNLTVATLLYLSKGLLPYSRRYIDETVLRSLDLTIGKKIIETNPISLDYFFREILDQEPRNVLNFCGYLDEINQAGLFTRILLRELRTLGRKLYPRQKIDEEVPKETKKFVKFLRTIATKSREEDVPLVFPGSKIKVGICLVAKPSGRELVRFSNRIRKYIRDREIEEIYIFATGKENVKLAKKIMRIFKDHTLIRNIKKQEYYHDDYRDSGKTFPGICITMVKGIIPESIKILIRILKENKGGLVGATLTTEIRKKKGFADWPKPDYKTVYSCLDDAENMELIELTDSGGDKTASLVD